MSFELVLLKLGELQGLSSATNKRIDDLREEHHHLHQDLSGRMSRLEQAKPVQPQSPLWATLLSYLPRLLSVSTVQYLLWAAVMLWWANKPPPWVVHMGKMLGISH